MKGTWFSRAGDWLSCRATGVRLGCVFLGGEVVFQGDPCEHPGFLRGACLCLSWEALCYEGDRPWGFHMVTVGHQQEGRWTGVTGSRSTSRTQGCDLGKSLSLSPSFLTGSSSSLGDCEDLEAKDGKGLSAWQRLLGRLDNGPTLRWERMLGYPARSQVETERVLEEGGRSQSQRRRCDDGRGDGRGAWLRAMGRRRP